MNSSHLSRSLAPADLLAMCALFAGCSSGSHDGYIPKPQSAREALDTALSAWKNGDAYATIDSVTPAVQTFDSRWQAGRKLQEFEIIDELEEEGPKQFLVRMTVEGEKEPAEVKYFVVGKDPLLVFREAEYEQTKSM